MNQENLSALDQPTRNEAEKAQENRRPDSHFPGAPHRASGELLVSAANFPRQDFADERIRHST